MKPQLLSVNIPGLDLTFGGGIWAVRRLPDTQASATLLIRGPPGSGKTVLGTRLAEALGQALDGDVAYGCIELLPVELQAQYTNLLGERAQERVIIPPFREGAPRGGTGCRIFAGLLDLGGAGQEQERLGPALLSLLDEVTRSGGHPRVLVIDSLSDGYGLGSAASRLLADSLCKLAIERGLMLILLEEIVDSRPSSWSFAVDTVMELDRGEQRRVTVLKNRFGPSEAGPHHFELVPRLQVFPHPSAYLKPWGTRFFETWKWPTQDEQSWSLGLNVLPQEWPPFRHSVTAVYGLEAHWVSLTAHQVGSHTLSGQRLKGQTVFIDFHRQPTLVDGLSSGLTNVRTIGAGDPYLSGHRLLAMVRNTLDVLHRGNTLLTKVLIGDLRSLRSFSEPDAIRRALMVLVALLREMRIPTVLFETSEAEYPKPSVVDFADVAIEVGRNTLPQDVAHGSITNLRTGVRRHWTL